MNDEHEAVNAVLDLVTWSQATGFDLGYLDADVPAESARWWVKATYRGGAILAQDHPSLTSAADDLARQIIEGKPCPDCGQPIALQAATAGCRWYRMSNCWRAACTELANNN